MAMTGKARGSGHRTRRRRGFTLMETVMVVAVGLGLLIGGIMFYAQAERSAREADIARRATVISAEIFAIMSRNAHYLGLTLDQVKASSSLPDDAFNDVTLRVVPQRFVLNFAGLERRQCHAIAVRQHQLGANVQWANCPEDQPGTLNISYGRT